MLVVLAGAYLVKGWHQIRQVWPGAGAELAMLAGLAVLYLVKVQHQIRQALISPIRTIQS